MGTRDRRRTPVASPHRNRSASDGPAPASPSRRPILKRPRVLVPLGILAALLITAVVAVRLLIDPERLKETALERARQATGYAMEAGPASVRLSWSGAGIRVESFRVASPDSAQTLAVARTDLYVKLLPLLRRQVELRELVLHEPRLVLREPAAPPAAGEAAESTAGARGEGPGGAGSEAAGGPAAEGSPALAILAVESWKVEGGSLRRSGGGNDLTLEGLDLEGGFRWSPEEGGRGSAEGRAASGRFAGEAGAFDLPSLEARARFAMNAAGDSLRLPEVRVESGEVEVQLEGGYALRGDVWTGALEGRADPVEWSALRELLPDSARAALAGKELGGRFTLEEFRVALTPEGETVVTGALAVEGVEARVEGAPLGFSQGSARVRFEPGRVALEDGRGRLGEEAITFAGRVEGEPLRRYRLRLATSLAGPVLAGLLPPSARLDLDRGALEVDLDLAGELPAGPERLPRVDGRVEARGMAGTLRDLPLHELAGTILFRGGGAEVKDLAARWGASDARLNGTVADLADPRLRFTLTGGLVDLDEMMPPEDGTGGEDAAAASADEATTPVGVPATGRISVDRLVVRAFELRDVRLQLDLGLDGLFLDDIAARIYGGDLKGRLNLVPAEAPGAWRYDGEATLAGVGAGPVVGRWLPAGERVEGRANADFTLGGRMVPGEDPRSGLTVEGDLSLDDGAFVNLPALRSVAEALQVREGMGERWPFRDLWMRFAVRGGRVVVDTLRVDQRGLLWRLAGSVGFAGDLDLAGTLRADPQVVTIPPEVRLFASYLAEADGRIPIDFRLGGAFADPSVSLDWTQLAERAAARAKEQEAESLRRQLEDAVGDPETLDRLQKLLGGKKKSSGG